MPVRREREMKKVGRIPFPGLVIDATDFSFIAGDPRFTKRTDADFPLRHHVKRVPDDRTALVWVLDDDVAFNDLPVSLVKDALLSAADGGGLLLVSGDPDSAGSVAIIMQDALRRFCALDALTRMTTWQP